MWPPSEHGLKKNRPTCPNQPFIVAAGRLVHQKGFDVLIRAFAASVAERQISLVIVGEGPERAALEELARRHGVERLVHLPGFVENPWSYFARAAAFVCSSRWEGFGNVIIEAMACGTPVVTTDCDFGPREIVRPVSPDCSCRLKTSRRSADAIVSVVDNRELAARLGEGGRQRARDFDVAHMTRAYERMFRELSVPVVDSSAGACDAITSSSNVFGARGRTGHGELSDRPNAQPWPYDHVHLLVPDTAAAANWYEKNFGGKRITEAPDRLMYGSTRFMFIRSATAKPSTGSAIDHVGFSVPDLDAKMKELEAGGVKIVQPVRDVPGLFKLGFVEDPWGTRIEVVQDPELLGLHHIHLRGPDPEAIFTWLLAKFGGERTKLKGRLDAVRYRRRASATCGSSCRAASRCRARDTPSTTSAGARLVRWPTPSTA